MRCVYCEHEDTRVIETRETGADVRRRRECASCGERFTTYERVELRPLRVIKRTGARELFDREKLKHGFLLACEKRPVTEEQIEDAITHVEQQLRKMGEPEVHSSVVGDLAMEQLRLLDHVAYIRFASVYKQFADVSKFEEEIRVLQGE